MFSRAILCICTVLMASNLLASDLDLEGGTDIRAPSFRAVTLSQIRPKIEELIEGMVVVTIPIAWVCQYVHPQATNTVLCVGTIFTMLKLLNPNNPFNRDVHDE